MKTVLAIVVGASALVQGAHAQSAVQWRVQDGGNGHWYQRFDTNWTWQEAQLSCQSLGGYLATSTSASENAFLNGVDGGRGSHLGGFQSFPSCEPSCDWQWVTGEPWVFSSWNTGEPNNSGGEDFLHFSGVPFRWNDATLGFRISSICEWSADCNSDGIVDYGQILAGDVTDTNTNGIPDCCELGMPCLDLDGDGISNPLDNCPTTPNPDQLDCNANGVGEACETGYADCNTNSIPDSCDIASGTSADADANGVPDTCQPDCNLNDLPDAFEIASGLVSDLNADGTPDDCQGARMVRLRSPNLGSPSGAAARVWNVAELALAESSVTVTVDVRGDLNGQTEWADIVLNDGAPRRFFQSDGSLCPSTPDRATITLDRAEFNDLVRETRTLSVRVECPATVDGTECKDAGLTEVALDYVGIADGGDCNGNERLDVVEVFDGTSPDCNANKRPDGCDIASGTAGDCDASGVPDSCELDATPSLDCNGNGRIDSCDLASGGTAVDCDQDGTIDSCQVAADPSSDCNGNLRPDACDVGGGTSADIDADGTPDECQTVSVPGDFGSIQAAIDAAPADRMRIIAVAAGTYPGPIAFNGKPVRVRGAGPSQTILDGTAGQQVSVVRFTGNEPSIAMLEGVTVRGGQSGTPLPSFPSALVGGGVFGIDSAAGLRNCVVEGNSAGFGAGAYFVRCSGSVDDCAFRGNSASADGGGFQSNQGTQRLTDVVVDGNYANSRGGGMHIVQGNTQLTRVQVTGNQCGNIMGGLSYSASLTAGTTLSLVDCAVTGNVTSLNYGGLGVTGAVGVPVSLSGTTICGNTPLPNMFGSYVDLGGNTVCDCAGDLNLDGAVNGADLGLMLAVWGPCGASCAYDLNLDGLVNGADLGLLLSAWGPCGG